MAEKNSTPCPICGGLEFGPGPSGRLSPNGMMPRSLKCGSLERHRAYRLAFQAISPWCKGKTALQFSNDHAAPRDPFTIFEISEFSGDNSLDLAAIDRADASVDMIIANHVLEHVEDDDAALKEMARVCRADGVVAISVPDLIRVARTKEYGRCREDKYGHWRIYGPDIAERMVRAVPDWIGVGVIMHDPVTGEPDRMTFLTKSPATAARLNALLEAAGAKPFDALA